MEEAVFKSKSNELNAEAARALAQLGDTAPARGETALVLFDWTEKAADVWRGSNPAIRREILDCVCLNRTLGDVSLCLVKRKPFDVLAEGLDFKKSRGDKTAIELFLGGVKTLASQLSITRQVIAAILDSSRFEQPSS